MKVVIWGYVLCWVGISSQISAETDEYLFESSPEISSKNYLLEMLSYLSEGWDAGFFHGNNPIRSWSRPLEAQSELREFSLRSVSREKFWSECYYNTPAIAVINQAYLDDNLLGGDGIQFPSGAVMVQLIWTNHVEEKREMSLSRSFNVHEKSMDELKSMSLWLATVNVAVRDPQVDSSGGWVFGTFGLDIEARSVENPIGLVPLGLTWGNDPNLESSSDDRADSQKIEQSWIAPIEGNSETVTNNEGRLVGFGMPKNSSCISCHSTAQYESVSRMLPPDRTSNENRRRWFRNLARGEAFDRGRKSLDFSMGLSLLLNENKEFDGKVKLPLKKERFSRMPLEPDIYPE